MAGHTSTLKICFIARALPTHRLGGLEYHARDLAVALAKRGHQVHILTTRGAGAGTGTDPSGITIHEINGTHPGDYSIGFFRKVNRAAKALCEQQKIDVLCPIDLAGLFINPREFAATVIPIIHGTMTSEVPLDWRYWARMGIADKARALWRYKSRIALIPAFRKMTLRMDTLLVDSEFTRRELMFATRHRGGSWQAGEKAAAMAQKIFVTPLGIDPQRYPPSMNGGETVATARGNSPLRICLLGRLQKIKGIAQAIQAARGLVTRGVKFEMTIGGTGEFFDEAAKMVSEFGLDNHVKLIGRVDPDQLGDFFTRHDLFLFPDLTQPAFGLVAVEAMHYGLPVVAADVGAVSEVVTEDCGWLYDAWDIKMLTGLLTRLADNRDEITRKKECVSLHREKFTAEKMAARVEVVFVHPERAQEDSPGF